MAQQPNGMEAMKDSWRNGGKVMIFAVVVFSVAMLFLASASLYVLLHRNANPPNPLESPSPEQIVDKLPAYHVGDTINVLGSKCNTSKTAVRIFGTSFWQSSDIGGPAGSIPSGGNTASGRDLQPGCMPLSFPHVIPNSVTPGKWRFVGRDCTDQGQCSDWFTDEIVVTGAP